MKTLYDEIDSLKKTLNVKNTDLNRKTKSIKEQDLKINHLCEEIKELNDKNEFLELMQTELMTEIERLRKESLLSEEAVENINIDSESLTGSFFRNVRN